MKEQSIKTAAPRRARSSPKRKMLTDLDPTVVLSVLTGVVAVCGLVNQAIFYHFFGISYIAYIGTDDFLALVLQAIPFTLLVVLMTLGVFALIVLALIFSRAGLVTSFWQLLLGLAALCRRILALLGTLFSRMVAWLLRRSDERAHVWSADRRDRVAAVAEAAQLLSKLCKSYEPACERRSAAYLQKRQEASQVRRVRIGWWLTLANRRYFEMFLASTLMTLLVGFGFSAAAGWRLDMRIQQTDDERVAWEMVDYAFSFFFPGFRAENSVSVDSLQPAIDNAIFLGATSEYGFFVRRDDGVSLVVPTAEIDLVTLGRASIPEELQKPEKDGEQLIAEQLGQIATSVTDVGDSLDRAGQGMVAFGASLLEHLVVPASLSADCRDNLIDRLDFRFAYGDSDPLAAAPLDGPTTAVSVEEYRGVSVAQYNAVQRARLVDYVTTTPFGYLPGDYLLVEGHASSEGTVDFNEELADRRATRVVEYLGQAAIWDHVEAFSRPDVIDISSTWQSPAQIRQSFRPIGRGEHAWQNDPEDPRNRHVLIYHCRPQPRSFGEQQMANATDS